jgi:hypothetical protein
MQQRELYALRRDTDISFQKPSREYHCIKAINCVFPMNIMISQTFYMTKLRHTLYTSICSNVKHTNGIYTYSSYNKLRIQYPIMHHLLSVIFHHVIKHASQIKSRNSSVIRTSGPTVLANCGNNWVSAGGS